MLKVISTALILMLVPLSALAEKRVGLVIGNDAYSDVPTLNKARADAEAISETLDGQGFDIVTVLDAPRREMNRRISEFTGKLEPGDTAFVFYAGHGVEIDGENYLLPTDIVAPGTGGRDFIKSESIALSDLLDRVRATGAKTTVAIVDACRNNPFKATSGRSIGSTRGLGRIAAPEGTFVIFSAGAGQLALDELSAEDPENNSVFTRLLLPYLSDPDKELRTMVSDLRLEVRNLARTVNHEQFPAYYDELLGDFYFAASATAPARSAAVVQPGAPQDVMARDFELARKIGTPDAIELFLDRYSDRRDDYTYQVALALLEQQSPPTEKRTDVQPAPTRETDPVAETDRKTILRDTQNALNAAGCNAGGADGVAGPRTKRAFSRFVQDTGADLTPGDLGTRKALSAVLYAGSSGCKAVAAAAGTNTGTNAGANAGANAGTAVSPAPVSVPAGVDLSGRWTYKAACPLVAEVRGTATLTRTGDNSYVASLQDSLNRSGNGTVTVKGTTVSSAVTWPFLYETATATLSGSGNSFSGKTSTGCNFTYYR